MSSPELIAHHCPTCDYNLQGNTSGRCPECGTPISYSARSRLPWLYRHHRGGARSYFQMTALLLFRPSLLAGEARHRVHVRHARRFHHESMLIAAALGVACLFIALLLRGTRLEHLLTPATGSLLASANSSLLDLFLAPALVLNDTLLILIPLTATVYLSLYASMWMYRQLFALSIQSPLARRRAVRLAYYASGLAPLLITSLGLFFILLILLGDHPLWIVAPWDNILTFTTIVFLLLAIALFCIPTFILLRRLTRIPAPRAILLMLVFPLLQIPLWLAIGLTIFWTTGYIFLACWSMTH